MTFTEKLSSKSISHRVRIATNKIQRIQIGIRRKENKWLAVLLDQVLNWLFTSPSANSELCRRSGGASENVEVLDQLLLLALCDHGSWQDKAAAPFKHSFHPVTKIPSFESDSATCGHLVSNLLKCLPRCAEDERLSFQCFNAVHGSDVGGWCVHNRDWQRNFWALHKQFTRCRLRQIRCLSEDALVPLPPSLPPGCCVMVSDGTMTWHFNKLQLFHIIFTMVGS